MKYTYKTIEKYVRLICSECREHFGKESAEKFLSQEQYNKQMNNPNKPWQCPDCRCYPCGFDDDYWELPLQK